MKNIKRIIGLFVLFALIAVGIFYVAVPASGQATNPDQQYPDTKIVAEAYSKRFSVSIDEAYRRLELQNSFPDLEPQLLSKEEATFGGLWIQHEPEYKIVVAFTHDGDKTITKYNDFIPAKIAPYIEVRTVNKSLNELLADQKMLTESLRQQGILTESSVDVFSNCVSIDITKGDESKFKSAEQKGDLIIPDNLKINIVNGLMILNTNIYGGLTLYDTYGNVNRTAGFAVKNSAGTKGIVTCYHNPTEFFFNSTWLPRQSYSYGGSCDCSWHTCPGFTVQNKIKIDNSGTTRDITGVQLRASQTLGTIVSKYGIGTGYSYGQLISKTFQPTSDVVPNATATWMEVQSVTNPPARIAGPYDSGGPWYSSYQAYGIHNSCNDADGGTLAVYMAVDYLSNIGVSVMTAP